jgi:hypothetical protein
MIARSVTVLILSSTLAPAVIVDRIAIVAGKNIIKESDINNDLRLTAFLNQEPLVFTRGAYKKAATRLLEQGFIREELAAGDYPIATVEEAQDTLNSLIKSRYQTETTYSNALAAYGIPEADLKAALLWQLTVLRFIDIRFRSSAYISDDEIGQYFESHKQQFAGDLNSSRSKIEEILSGERTNKAFYEWLDHRRQAETIRYLEDSLR